MDTAKIDLYRRGNFVTIKYTFNGPNTYADDKLTIRGNVMTGRDASGATITYTRQ